MLCYSVSGLGVSWCQVVLVVDDWEGAAVWGRDHVGVYIGIYWS